MIVLGIDESMTATGLALVKDGVPLNIETCKLVSVKNDAKGEQLIGRIQKLFKAIDSFTKDVKIDAMAVERTDWMRNLSGRNNWKSEYAIERRNQEALALLQGALAAYAIDKEIEFMLLGVNEWHKEFGAGNKDAIAELLAQEYPSLIEKNDEDKFEWVGEACPYIMNNNETDALGIALVAYNRLNQQVKVMA